MSLKNCDKGRDLSIIIPVAGQGKRMRANGAKALLTVGSESIIERQLRQWKNLAPEAEIIFVVGFEARKVCKRLPNQIWVLNKDFENTNVAYSIGLAIQKSVRRRVLVSYGDLIFEEKGAAPLLACQKTSVFVDDAPRRTYEVGVAYHDNEVTNFSFGLPRKWSQLVMLCEREKEMFAHYSLDCMNHKFFSFEIFNKIISRGGTFSMLPYTGYFFEIDSTRDLWEARVALDSISESEKLKKDKHANYVRVGR